MNTVLLVSSTDWASYPWFKLIVQFMKVASCVGRRTVRVGIVARRGEVGKVRGRNFSVGRERDAFCLPRLAQYNLARAKDMPVLWITNASSCTLSSILPRRGWRLRQLNSRTVVLHGSKIKLKGKFIKENCFWFDKANRNFNYKWVKEFWCNFAFY